MVEGGPAMSMFTLSIQSTLRGFEEIDLSDIAGNPSPRPSPRGRGRAVSVTCQCIFFVEWEVHVQVTPLDRPRRSIALSRRERDGVRACRQHPLVRFLHTL